MEIKLVDRSIRITPFLVGVLLPLLCGIQGHLTAPPSTTVTLGEDVALVCTTTETDPIFTWTDATNGQLLYFGSTRGTSIPRYDNIVLVESTDAQTSVLNIHATQPEDEGNYRCSTVSEPTDTPLTTVTVEVCGTIPYWRESRVMPDQPPRENVDISSSVVSGWSSTQDRPTDDRTTDEEEPMSWISDYPESEARRVRRVVGGLSTHPGSAPYMVRVSALRGDEWTTICGGTLLNQRWIMTSANCMFDGGRSLIAKENLRFLLGDFDVMVQEDSEQERRPAEIIVHDEYNPETLDNDIALIRIEPPIREFTPYIRPICLAPDSLSSRLMTSGNLGRVTGWGRESVRGPLSRFLKEVELPIVDRRTCRRSVADHGLAFTDSMFCAGYHSAHRDACGGDSGGPLAVRNDDGRWYQLGIVSWGIGCGGEGEYGFYTHVSRFLPWMRANNVTSARSP